MTRPRSRPTDPDTSAAAGRSITKLQERQNALMCVMRVAAPVFGAALLDQEIIEAYEHHRSSLGLVEQSESGLRSRRAELAEQGWLAQGDRRRTASGRTGRTWYVAPRREG